jgi:hypothetical protein
MPEIAAAYSGKAVRMGKKTTLVCTMLVVLVLTMAAPASKEGISPHPVQAQSLDLTVRVDCEGEPETTTIQNDGTTSVTIETVGSIHEPRSNEPFAVDEPLDAGGSITFESGTGAAQNVLTEQFIYDNEVGSEEGAEVITSTGESFTARCGAAPGGTGQGNPGGSGGGGGSATEQQYRGETIVGIPPKKKLSKTGGPPLLGVVPAAGVLWVGLLLLKRTWNIASD